MASRNVRSEASKCTDITAIAGGGTASIEELAGGVRRKVEYRDGGNGIAKRYWRDGTEQPIDADGARWLATIIPTMMREAGIEAEARVARIYNRGGAQAVLDEIVQIESDHARGVYLRALLGSYQLSPEELDDTLKFAGAVGSDYERRNVLSVALAKQKMGRANFAMLLKIAAGIGSDYERAELLVGMLPRLAKEDDVRAAWLEAALGIKGGISAELERTGSRLRRAWTRPPGGVWERRLDCAA